MKGGMTMPETRLTLVENVSDYAVELPTLWYDRKHLEKHLKSIPDRSWYAFDCGHIRWTVHEEYDKPRLECKNYRWTDFHQELAELFNPPIMPDTMLLTATPIGGVPPHIDSNRFAILNFAIQCEFHDASPQTFYEDFDKPECFRMEYTMSNETLQFSPWLFKGSKVHGVDNQDDPDRVILSCCWRHNTYEEIRDGILDGSMINWEVNERNQHVKFVS